MEKSGKILFRRQQSLWNLGTKKVSHKISGIMAAHYSAGESHPTPPRGRLSAAIYIIYYYNFFILLFLRGRDRVFFVLWCAGAHCAPHTRIHIFAALPVRKEPPFPARCETPDELLFLSVQGFSNFAEGTIGFGRFWIVEKMRVIF